jgi:3-hydroxybutyrate dehydrogenase
MKTRAEQTGLPLEEAGRQLLAEKQPTLRFTTVEQLGALAVFLCSEGGANMTGTALPVDGGWLAQ